MVGRKEGRYWSRETVDNVRRLCGLGWAESEICEAMGFTEGQVRSIVRKHHIDWTSKHSLETKFTRRDLFPEEARDKERDAIYKKYKGREMRWLILADIHYPFHHSKTIEMALNEKNIDGVITSEVMDFYGLSKFRKNKLIPLVSELAGGLELVAKMKKLFGNVIWFEANHERRLWHMLQDRMAGKEDVIQVLDIKPPVMKKMVEAGADATAGFWVKVGRMVVAHPDWYNNPPMRTAIGTQDYFLSKETAIWKDTDVIVNNHTHRLGQIFFRGQALYESGCSCKEMDYTKNGQKVSKNGETQRGYVVIHLNKDGSFDFNKSKIVKGSDEDC